MSEVLLTTEDAIFKHDSLRFAEESKPLVYRCDKLDLNGILLVTNLRMSFYYKDPISEELKFLHYLFNMTNKIRFYPNSQTNIVEVSNAYEWVTFIFRSRMNVSEFREFLNKNFPDIVEVSDIVKESPLKNKTFEKNDKPETDIFSQEKPKLLHFENWFSLKRFTSNIFVYILNIGSIIAVLYFTSLFFPEIGQRISGIVNYPGYWINKQRCEKDMFIIADKMNQKNEYPQNITEFILKNFKITNKVNQAKDPWGNLYEVQYKDDKFKIISYGPDKKVNTSDDIAQEFAKINK